MSARLRFSLLGLCVAIILPAAITVPVAMAQKTTPRPLNTRQGFFQNCDQSVQIEADTLEVRDKDKVAIFVGNVRVAQGDITLRSKTLVVYYEQSATPGAVTAAPAASSGGQQRIRRLEAKGGVTITRNGQTATGERAIYDIASNSVTLTGNAVVTQGANVVRGDRLWVDLTTGVSRIESANAADGRVQALLQPGGTRERGYGKDSERHAPTSARRPESASNSVVC